MEQVFDEIWRAGFETGQRMLSCRCPFLYHSPQADAWEDGWMQGLLKQEGLAYRDHPLSKDFNVPGRTVSRLRQWRLWR